jgi:8-oxo-dGTP diphosphatase
MEKQRPYLAVYCIVRDADRILLMKRANTGYSDGFVTLPAGHVDEGESVRSAASRELLEETGLIVQPLDWQIYCTMHRKTNEREVVDVFLEARHWIGTATNREPAKCSWMEFARASDTQGEFIPYVSTALKQLLSPEGWNGSPLYLEFGW